MDPSEAQRLTEEINYLKDKLQAAEREADYWKEVADALEFGNEKPDHSIPPRADGA